MAHPYVSTPPISGRVYFALVLQALPYAIWSGVAGTLVGLALGALASLASLDTLDGIIVTLYTVAGFFIGTAIGIRPVFRELLAFHWSADVHAR